MAKTLMQDLVVVLPGITGSVLQKDGKDIWALSGESLWQYISSRGASLDSLRLPPHPPDNPPDDGVRATRVVSSFHGIFGLAKIDGYTDLVQAIKANFSFPDNNLIIFPYDWRLSNSFNAKRLKDVIDKQLKELPSYNRDTGVILIAHSMGGLVSRYYLEVLEGWRHCRAFITFGTPFRGSVNAVDYLANGYKKLFVNLTDIMRTFPSVYELMPRYKMLKVGAEWLRVAEVDKLPAGINSAMAKNALEFHHKIDKAVEENKKDPSYDSNKWKYHPVVGVRQKTLQSAVLTDDRRITADSSLPENINDVYDGGDGTVPRVSATPIEISDIFSEIFVVEQHASLQNNEFLLDDMIERLRQMQSPGGASVKGIDLFGASDTAPDLYDGNIGFKEESWISLQLQDVYFRDEPVQIKAEFAADPNFLFQGLEAIVKRVDVKQQTAPTCYDFQSGPSSRFVLNLSGLDPGRYSAHVRTKDGASDGPRPVTAIFEVAGLSGT